jgi:predicted nucleic acid-binding protein
VKPIVVDTTLWIEWFRGQKASAKERLRGAILYMPAVVAMELLSGVQDRRSYKLVDDLLETFSKNQRFLIPNKTDYVLAGNTLADLGWPASKKSNDALIAACARRLGAEIWACDRDFVTLAKMLRLTGVWSF